MREHELSDPVSAWLRSFGYEVYAEIPFCGMACDLVGWDRTAGKLVAVELKLVMSHRVIHQAMTHQVWADESWVAVATRPRAKSHHGLGVLSLADGVVRVVARPTVEPGRPLLVYRQGILDRLSVRCVGGVGGKPNGTGNGPAQDVARLVAPLRARGISWDEIFRTVPNHYANPRSLAGVMLGYGPARRILDAAREERT